MIVDRTSAECVLREALARGGDFADVYVERRAKRSIGWSPDGRDFSRSASLGTMVRVLDDGALRSTATEGWNPALIVPASDDEPDDSSFGALVALAERAGHAALEGRVTRVSCHVEEERRESLVVTSDGVVAHRVRSSRRLKVRAMVVTARRRTYGLRVAAGRDLLEDEAVAARCGVEAADQARRLLDGRTAPAGELPLVLAAGHGGILLHEAIGHGLEADQVRVGTSPYAGRLGAPIASELVTLVDDPAAAAGGGYDVDDEGTPSSATVLVDRGRLASYLHDRRSAQAAGQAPTGNGRRASYAQPVLPRMSNTYLANGSSARDEILRSVERGIYALDLDVGSVDMASGDFSFCPSEAYLIENGAITTPLRPVTIRANGPEVLHRIAMVGDDFAFSAEPWDCVKNGQLVTVGVGCPTFKVDRVEVCSTRLR